MNSAESLCREVPLGSHTEHENPIPYYFWGNTEEDGGGGFIGFWKRVWAIQ